MCALSQHTRSIGLVCTSTSTFDQPYLLARRFASLESLMAQLQSQSAYLNR